jgi:hypothetical protein
MALTQLVAPRPSDEEQKLLAQLNRIDGEAKHARLESKYSDRMEQAERWRYGDQWAAADERPVFEGNVLGNLVERKVATLTQTRPDIRVLARNVNLQKATQVLTQTCRALFDEMTFDQRLEYAANIAATFGATFFNVAWDPHADAGTGNIVINPLDPRRVWVDPRVESTNEIQKSNYLRIDTPMPLETIRATWPGRGAMVQPDPGLSTFREHRQPGTWWGNARQSLRPSTGSASPYQWAVISEYWLADTRRNPDKATDFLFPSGRVIHRPLNQPIVLDDAPNPYWDGGWPLVGWDWRQRIGSVYGVSDVEEGRKAQEAFLRLSNAMVQNVLLTSNVTIVGDHNALTPEDWKKLDNRAARVLKKSRGSELQVVPPPALPDTHFQLADSLTRVMEMLLGVSKAMQGDRQDGVIASSAIEGLQTASEVLVRAASRRLEYALEQIGQLLVSRIIQFYSADRVMALLSPTAEWIDYVYKRQDLLAPDTTEDERRNFFRNFRFKITPLSSLPIARIQRALLAREFFAAGLVDDVEVLRQAEYPNYEEVLRRTRDKQATGQLPVPDPNATKKKSNRSGTKISM